jgi:hypothetical protein
MLLQRHEAMRLQERMFNQYQASMNMVVQLLGQCYQDNFSLIRDEMARLQEIARELYELHSQRRAADDAVPSPPQGPIPVTPLPGDKRATPVQPSPKVDDRAGQTAAKPSPSSPLQHPRKTTDQQGHEFADGGQGNEAFHSWLSHRVLSLETEQETLWQKIATYLKVRN